MQSFFLHFDVESVVKCGEISGLSFQWDASYLLTMDFVSVEVIVAVYD